MTDLRRVGEPKVMELQRTMNDLTDFCCKEELGIGKAVNQEIKR